MLLGAELGARQHLDVREVGNNRPFHRGARGGAFPRLCRHEHQGVLWGAPEAEVGRPLGDDERNGLAEDADEVLVAEDAAHRQLAHAARELHRDHVTGLQVVPARGVVGDRDAPVHQTVDAAALEAEVGRACQRLGIAPADGLDVTGDARLGEAQRRDGGQLRQPAQPRRDVGREAGETVGLQHVVGAQAGGGVAPH